MMPGWETFDAILIGCSMLANNNSRFRGFCERRSSDRACNPLSGVEKDLKNMENFLTEKGVRSITKLSPTGEQCSSLLNQLRSTGNKRNLLIYYSGHGRRDDGAWCIQNGSDDAKVLRPVDLLNTGSDLRGSLLALLFGSYRDSIFGESFLEENTHLFIISDSCFSGCWIEELNSHPSIYHKVSIFASCEYWETSMDTKEGGMFTLRLLENRPIAADKQNPCFHSWKTMLLQPVGSEQTIYSQFREDL